MSLAIQPYIEHIRDALWRIPDRGLASVMVGAGFSRNSTPAVPGASPLPLWDELARIIAAGIGLDKDNKPRDPLQIAQMYEATRGRAELHRLLERCLPDSEHRPGSLHRRLLTLPWADVFTTNYDTLLERARTEVFNRHYECVLTPTDIPMRCPPRLVKLHGSLGSGGRLIITQDDYRKYPQSHAPFVNLVRQSVMETVFVLIGFAGDDPNFLEWTGWVRDILGDHAPKIYLCGLIDSSPATRALLDSRRVTPIDLSEVAVDCSEEERHARALDWLIAALETGRPGRDSKWAPNEPPTLPNRTPPLPSARTFTAFSEFPKPTQISGPDLAQIRSAAAIWRTQRKEYPGWHVPPNDIRERVWQATHRWRSFVFHHGEKLDAVEKIEVAFELCWRLELCLSPIFTNEADQLVKWLEAVNPFGAALNLPSASVVCDNSASAREAWIALGLSVLRTSREDLDERRYQTWRFRLLAIAETDQLIAGELYYEEALWHINRLDLASFRKALATWRANAKYPLELARLTALFAEIGDKDIACDLGTTALKTVRESNRGAFTVSLEAWCCLILQLLHRNNKPIATELRERIDLAKEQGYDPWTIIESLRVEVDGPRPRWGKKVELTAGFDAGDIRRTVHFGSGESPQIAAYWLLRLSERAPCPLYVGNMGLIAESAAMAAAKIGDAAPLWSTATLIRAGANKELVHGLFDRATIALLDSARVDQLYSQLLNLITSEIGERANSTKTGVSAVGHRTLGTAIDVLSRITLRLAEKELRTLIVKSTEWLVTPSVTADYELMDPLNTLLGRLGEAAPVNMRAWLVEQILQLPIYGEADYQPRAPEEIWPEPFAALWDHLREIPPPVDFSKSCSAAWQRILNGIRSSDPSLRRRAFLRGYVLADNNWVASDQQEELSRAVWSQCDSVTGLPEIRGFRSSVMLHLHAPADRDVTALVKRNLLGRELAPWKLGTGEFNSDQVKSVRLWLNEITSVFRHRSIASPQDTVLPLQFDEATDLLKRLLGWWPSAIEILDSPRFRNLQFGGFDLEPVARAFISVLSESLLFYIPKKHPLVATTEGLLEQLSQKGISTTRTATVRLFHSPESLVLVTTTIEAALLSTDEMHVRDAAASLTNWSRAARVSLVPKLPEPLIDLVVSRIALRKWAGLDSVISCASNLVKTDYQLTRNQEELLTRALGYLADDTSVFRLRNKFEAGEIDRVSMMEALNVRSWAGVLASSLAASLAKRGEALPDALQQWHMICENDPLPETRQAWSIGDQASL